MSIERIPSGISELDEVLAGGFPANSLNIMMGAPGTGKTILAEQIVFTNAARGVRALYLTTLSEPLEKFIEHGQTQGFFDAAQIGETIFYEDLGLILRERGTSALTEVVTEMLAAYKPGIVVMDSFKALNDLHQTGEERRLMIFDLASVLSAYASTNFLVGEYGDEMMTELPEFAIADGIIQLIKKRTGAREQRFLRVEKMRGSDSVPGLHAFDITDRGIEVYPRLLTPAVPPAYIIEVERVNTGIAGLDEMIEKGFWRGSTTLVAGPTGSGKTIMGLQFLREGARAGESSLYVGFQENPMQIAGVMNNFRWQPEELFEGGNFDLMYHSPVEMQLDSVATAIFRRIRKGGVKRIVIDALGDLRRRSLDQERFSDYMYALKQWFAVENVTCLMLLELENLFEFHKISTEEISNMSDNVVLLRYSSDVEMQRTIRIIKTRGSAHDHRECHLDISDQGVTVNKKA